MPEWHAYADIAIKAVIAFATIALGYRAWQISSKQAQTASDKLKLDLFDRRYTVYLAINEWINDLQSRIVPDEDYTAHMRKIDTVQFLYGPEVNEWLMGLRKNARSMNRARRTIEEQTESPSEGSQAQIIEANQAYSLLTMEFDRDLKRINALFAPYLDFRKVF